MSKNLEFLSSRDGLRTQASRSRRLRKRFLVSAVLVCSMPLHGCGKESLRPSVFRTVEQVNGFDLVLDDAKSPVDSGLFEIGYAIKSNYAFFTYRGRLYQSVGAGSVVIRDVADSPARFIVRETVLARGRDGRTSQSLLEVIAKSSGEELARRRLIDGAVEDGNGWSGDHAVRFVRQVLGSTQLPNRPWNVVDYPQADARVTFVSAGGADRYPRSDAAIGCPGDVRVVRRPSRSSIVAPRFEFLPASPLLSAACDSGMLLVASEVYASELNLDLLALDGTPLAQGKVRLPVAFGADLTGLSDVRLDATRVEFVISVNDALPTHQWSAYGKLSASVRLSPTSSHQAP